MTFGSKKGNWEKGKTGNPKGRPRKFRALAAVLETGAEEAHFGDVDNGSLLSRHIWQGLTTGKIVMPGGTKYDLSAREWLELVKWVHQHVDGTVNFGVHIGGMEADEEESRTASRYEITPEEQQLIAERNREGLISTRKRYSTGELSEENFRFLINLYGGDWDAEVAAAHEAKGIASGVVIDHKPTGYDPDDDEEAQDPKYDHEQEYQRLVAEFEVRRDAEKEATRQAFFEQVAAERNDGEIEIVPSPVEVAMLRAFGEAGEYDRERR
jgi:hypothetical protein